MLFRSVGFFEDEVREVPPLHERVRRHGLGDDGREGGAGRGYAQHLSDGAQDMVPLHIGRDLVGTGLQHRHVVHPKTRWGAATIICTRPSIEQQTMRDWTGLCITKRGAKNTIHNSKVGQDYVYKDARTSSSL